MAEIVGGLFGITPESLQAQRDAQAQQEALAYAQLSDPFARANYQIYQGASGLGRQLSGLLGAQDPEMAKAAALQGILKQADTTTPEGLAALAKTLGSQGFGAQAMQVMDKARQAQTQAATLGKTLAEQRKVEMTVAQEEALRKELADLGPNATEADIMKAVTKYGSADKVLATLQASADRTAARQQQMDLQRERIQAQIDMARERGATQAQIAQMQIEGRVQLAQLAASLKGEKPLTEFQGKSLTFGTRAAEAHNILNSLEGTYNTLSANYLPSFINSPEGQKAKQAQDNFVNAVLRQESGAAINASEFENARKQYFPQPGDTQAVLDQKRQNRETVIKGFSRQAGPAGKDIVEALNAPILKPLKTSFNSVAEAEAANLPKGTKITIGGKKAIVE